MSMLTRPPQRNAAIASRYVPMSPLHPGWRHSHVKSGVSSIAAHCALQYLSSAPTVQLHGGCAHFFVVANSVCMAFPSFSRSEPSARNSSSAAIYHRLQALRYTALSVLRLPTSHVDLLFSPP